MVMKDPPAHGKLSAFQDEVLRAFFQRERGFFLTGGGALCGFHLGHRETGDLDLFTVDAAAFERGRHVARAVADECNASLEVLQDAPGFRRITLSRAEDALVVDFVHERVKQVCAEKPEIDDIVIDPPEEILANKLTAIVGRCEERDLVDVLFLERSGLRVEDALAGALDKDGGCTPATIAWLLSQMQIPDGASLPAGVTAAELRDYIQELVPRLRRIAAPSGR